MSARGRGVGALWGLWLAAHPAVVGAQGRPEPVPTASVSIPGTSASIPTASASIPGTSVSIPGTSVSIPGTSASIPATTALWPTPAFLPGPPRALGPPLDCSLRPPFCAPPPSWAEPAAQGPLQLPQHAPVPARAFARGLTFAGLTLSLTGLGGVWSSGGCHSYAPHGRCLASAGVPAVYPILLAAGLAGLAVGAYGLRQDL